MELEKRRLENGASEGIRTLDTHVGNVMLYQAELRSRPNQFVDISAAPQVGKRDFFRKRKSPPASHPTLPAVEPTTPGSNGKLFSLGHFDRAEKDNEV